MKTFRIQLKSEKKVHEITGSKFNVSPSGILSINSGEETTLVVAPGEWVWIQVADIKASS